jgi:hypothetical protein
MTLLMTAPPNGLDRSREAFDPVERRALAFIKHPRFTVGDFAEVVDLGGHARHRGGCRSDENTEGLVFGVARLFRDAPVCIAVDPLAAVEFVDRSQVGGLSFSVLIDGSQDRVTAGAAAKAAAGIAAATALLAATERKRRRFVSIGVFVGGVLCTRSARVIWRASFVVRVRAGAEVATFPSA